MDVQYKQYPGKNKSLLEYEIMLSNIDDDSIWNSDGSYLIQSIASLSSSSSSAFTKHIHLKKLSGSLCDTGPKPPSSSSSSSSSSSGNTKMDTNIFRAKHFHRYSEKKKNNFYTDNLIVFLVLAALLLFHQFDSCDCLLPSPPRYEHKTLKQQHQTSDDDNGGGGGNQVRMTISNTGLANIRLVRSYSEEFMSSSEERERGLQFFGGSSAGSSSSSSSTMNKRISPYFETESLSTNVTISEGSAFVHLPCRVKQLGDRTLSWIRRQDVQILTVGTFTYISDQRFQAIHRENSDDWSLQISYPRKKDAGIYECQVSTMPKMSLFIQLNVIVSRAKILEGPVLYLSSGSTLNLTCVVKDTPEPPDYIFWYHNGQVINYGSPRDVKVYTEKSAQTISSKLIILKAQANDSGNYSCTPSNAEPAHIAVHIQNNANPAASIQHGKRSASREYGSNKSMRMSCTIGPLQMAVTTTMITIMLSIALYL